jgi:putative oxidoreductase
MPLSWSSRGKIAGLWVLTLLLAFFFIYAGWTKLVSDPASTNNFVRWGYPTWFRNVIGLLEGGGALLLLVPRLAGLAAILLGMVMIGATATHLVHDEMEAAPVPLVLLALITLVGYSRFESVRFLLRRLKRESA